MEEIKIKSSDELPEEWSFTRPHHGLSSFEKVEEGDTFAVYESCWIETSPEDETDSWMESKKIKYIWE